MTNLDSILKSRDINFGDKGLSSQSYGFSCSHVWMCESVRCIRWPKYWSFSISPSNEYSGLISLRINWFDLFAVQGTFKGLLEHHSSKTINSLVLSLLYGATLTSIHNYQKNHS